MKSMHIILRLIFGIGITPSITSMQMKFIHNCSNFVLLVPIHPIFISILFHHYKELMQLEAQVDQVKEGEEEQPKELVGDEYVTNTNTLDRYFIITNRLTESQ